MSKEFTEPERLYYGDSKRLAEEIKRVFVTQTNAARKLGISQARVWQLIQAGTYKSHTRDKFILHGMNMAYIEQDAPVTDMSEELIQEVKADIAEAMVEMAKQLTEPKSEYATNSISTPPAANTRGGMFEIKGVPIPYWRFPAANAGMGIDFLDMQKAGTIMIPSGLIRTGRAGFAIDVSGESMTDSRIMDGVTVVVEQIYEDSEAIGEVVVANVDGVTYVKRLLRNDKGQLVLRSESSGGNYPDIRIEPHTQYIIHGIVVSMIYSGFRKNGKKNGSH